MSFICMQTDLVMVGGHCSSRCEILRLLVDSSVMGRKPLKYRIFEG